MQSPLYDLVEHHTLVLVPETGTAPKPVYNRETQTSTFPPPSEPKEVRLDVALFGNSQGSRPGSEQPTLEVSQSGLVIQIVGTEGDAPLKLPEGVIAGDGAEMTIFGRKGKLEILPLSPTQIPEVSDEMGWLYSCTWSVTG